MAQASAVEVAGLLEPQSQGMVVVAAEAPMGHQSQALAEAVEQNSARMLLELTVHHQQVFEACYPSMTAVVVAP